MAQILAVVLAILSRVVAIAGLTQTLLNLANQVSAYLFPTSGVSQITAIQNTLVSVNGDVENVTYGLAALHTELVTLQAAVTALGSPQQAGSPVTLPPVPPSDYGAQDAASAVWLYVISPDNVEAQEYLAHAGHYAFNQGPLGVIQGASSPFMQLIGAVGSEGYAFAADTGAVLNPANILSTDSLGDWLNREWPLLGPQYWLFDATVGLYYYSDTGYSLDLIWQCKIDNEWWLRLKAAAVGATTVAAPIWPGLGGVTFISGVALEDNVVCEGPMDGVEVLITAAPPGAGQFDFNGELSYRWIGALAFEDDNGYVETPQNLGFTQAVYLPKTMAHAARVRFRVKAGVTGPVYPFTIP